MLRNLSPEQVGGLVILGGLAISAAIVALMAIIRLWEDWRLRRRIKRTLGSRRVSSGWPL